MKYNTPLRSDEGILRVAVDPAVYTKEAILATAYSLTRDWYVTIDATADRATMVSFAPEIPTQTCDTVVHDFLNQLIDQQLRLQLRHETAELHRLIVSEAFAPLDSKEDET